MIRAIRPNAMAQDDAALVSGWNVAPNLAYTLLLLPGASSCGVLLYDEDGSVLIASGAALVGNDQPLVLIPQTGQTVEMVDADLGWHLRLTTTGTESQRTIRLGPAVDLPDEIHPVYGDDDLALVRATAAIDAAAHYIDDVTVTCPLGLGAGLGDVVSVPVDGASVIGQVESITWTATPDGTSEQAVVRRHVPIAPEAFVEIVPPSVADDTGAATSMAGASGNVLANDESGLTVVAVNGLLANVGTAVDGDNGGSFVIAADGAWTFDPSGDFALLSGSETADTSVTYHASDGTAEAVATLTITVSHANTAPVAVDDTGATTANTTTSGNVLSNDTDADLDDMTVSQVAGSAANVGVAVPGSNGGLFTIASDGAWTFDPYSDFDSLTGDDTTTTSVTYHVSDGVDENEGTLTITVSAAAAGLQFIGSAYGGVQSGASYSVDLPDGVLPGDIVIVATGYTLSTNTDPGVLSPSGYVELADLYSNDSYDTNLSVCYKIMGSTTDESITVAGSGDVNRGAATCVHVWRGVDQTNPIDVTSTTNIGGNTASADPPAITPVTDRAVVLSLFGSVTQYAATITAPSSLDNVVSHSVRSETTTGLAFNCGIGSYQVDIAGSSIDISAWSVTGGSTASSWAAAAVVVRPAS